MVSRPDYPTRLSQDSLNGLMIVDLNRRYANAWSMGINHPRPGADLPEGGNHATVDGSVRWILADLFLAAPAYVMAGPTEFFFLPDP